MLMLWLLALSRRHSNTLLPLLLLLAGRAYALQVYSHVTPERIAQLKAGAVQLPLSERFQLSSPVSTRGGSHPFAGNRSRAGIETLLNVDLRRK